ncbi:hypothetical protein Q5H93_22195 [Hymenobacter sp. ASUV-10]|uniref:Right handed beta helix domain-containing protein n=1 Tax=Hymenobacter aranciens TaxID=3063996 RepID=A0ABT9BLC1_9BACT|nr:hypothetical protein [Hymenobacter sp. ASUV-10]MDO7877466.1 hypothetical protein [Hymenobacter sp. ASUV-10]
MTGASAANTISFVPATGVTPVISGSVAGATTGLIVLNGADNLRFDGYNGSTSARNITIRNTATTGAAVLLQADATSNALRYLNLESATINGSSGTAFFSTGTTSSNDDNTLSNCDIHGAGAAVPAYAVFTSGAASTTATNSGNTVQSCNVYDFTAGGVYMSDTGAGGRAGR